jgi:hypothetical protein
MPATYGFYLRYFQSNFRRVEAVQGLEKAKERMAHLALTSPGEYFIHSQDYGVIAKQTQQYLE